MAWWLVFALLSCSLAANRDEWVWGDNNRRASRIIDGPTLSLNGGSYGLNNGGQFGGGNGGNFGGGNGGNFGGGNFGGGNFGGGKPPGVYNNRPPGGYNDRYADGPLQGGFGRPPIGGPQGFPVAPPPLGGPGGGFPPLPPNGPAGPGFNGGRPPVAPGRVPPYEDLNLKEPGLHTGGYDTCKCTLSFNCNSPGIKFGVCDEGKQYCCYNSHIAGSNRRPNNFGGPAQIPAVLAGPGGPRDFPPGAPVPPPQHRPGPHHGGVGVGRPPVPDVLVGPGGPYDLPPQRPPFGGGPFPYSGRKTKDL